MSIERTASKHAEQGRHDDAPAQDADHREILTHGPLALALPPGATFLSQPDSVLQMIVIFRFLTHCDDPSSGATPLPLGRTDVRPGVR
jgi:hypothetical protein